MIRFAPIFAVLFFCFGSALGNSIEDPRIVQLVEELRSKAPNAGMAVAVVSKNEIKHVSLHGTADIETNQELTSDSLFMIGSTTKAMTATLGAIAMSRSKLTWDARVKDYLAQFTLVDQEAAEACSLRDLLLHRSGVARHDYAWLAQPMDSEGYLELFGKMPPAAKFREKFQYQNLGYMTAGLMIGDAMGGNWSELLTSEVFEPLGMHHSRARSQDLIPTDKVAQPHGIGSSGIKRIEPRNIDAVGPAGSVYSSVSDMSKWLQFNLNAYAGETQLASSIVIQDLYRPQILARAASEDMPEYGDAEYGLGWIISTYRGQKIIEDGGGIDGYLTQVMLLPESDIGIVILTNGGSLIPNIVGLTLADYLLGEGAQTSWFERFNQQPTPQQPPEGITFPESYESAAGEYRNEVYGKLFVRTVEVEGIHAIEVELGENTGFIYTVAPWIVNEREWIYQLNGTIIQLEIQDGEVSSVAVNWERSLPPVKFERIDL